MVCVVTASNIDHHPASQPEQLYLIFLEMGCCNCFGLFFSQHAKKEPVSATSTYCRGLSQEHLLGCSKEEAENATRNGTKHFSIAPVNQFMSSFSDRTGTDGTLLKQPFKELRMPASSGGDDHCHGHVLTVRESHRAIRGEDGTGKKMINEYVKEGNIAIGSYAKVALYRSKLDGKLYAMKIFHKSRLRKIKVGPSETAMMDVMREVSIMKQLDHPNIVKLIEVIDDPESDHLYMVLEYLEGRSIFEGSGPPGGIGEATARRYFRDIAAGLVYLHNHRIVHGDIKPENLLISSDGRVKIGDFSVSQMFEDDNDELRRSPGTPVYTAPECCLGLTYHGKPADIWALGATLYCMVLGHYPFVGDTVQSTYDEIIQSPLRIPEGLNPELVDLLEGLLCKDPNKRMKLDAAVKHPWVMKGFGSLQQEH